MAYLRAFFERRQLLLDLVHGVGVDEGAVVQGADGRRAGVPVTIALLQGQLRIRFFL
jgi:hypothetical protein